jgi:quinoprotein glucose dehydrogenase
MTSSRTGRVLGFLTAVALLAVAPKMDAQSGAPPSGEWPHYGGDNGFTKYSPLDQINPENVRRLRIVWRRPAVAEEIRTRNPGLKVPNNFRSTPVMIGGVLYASNGIGLVEAFDPATGKTIWVQDLPDGEPVNGSASRGVAYWRSGNDERILVVRGEYLWAIDARTGKLIPTFGDKGRVNLRSNLGPLATRYFWTNAPLVCNDVVIVGLAMSDSPVNQEAPPGKVQAFDIRSGTFRWAFNPIPRPGEFGNETWENDSWSYTGAANVWTMMSADEALGYAYLPTGAPTSDMYGGHRLGDNLFSNSLVCVKCATGERVWHFQTVHHDLWDYDNTAAPILADISVNGKPIKAVVQLTKQAMAFVFDRETGQPVWPIEERQVPKSSTPGERTSPTQPFPTRPAPFDRHGLSMDDLIDFTPELRAEARAIASRYVLGPIYTPPSIAGAGPGDTKGTLQVPTEVGGAEWGGAAFDPETGMLYVPSVTGTFAADLLPGVPAKTNLRYTRGTREIIAGPRGLPLMKPLWGRVTAIDLTSGEHKWVVPNGDGPRDHPSLKHLNLPPLGQPSRDMPLATRTLLFVSQGDAIMVATPPSGANGRMLRVHDKRTGAVLHELQLPAGTTGALMTYRHQGRQYLVAPIGGSSQDAEFVALGLP